MKPFAVILLLLHINASMFIAQVDELDVYDAKGQQLRDIDTLTDWLEQSLSAGKPSKQQQQDHDKDDDNARYFHPLKLHNFFSPHFVLVKKPALSARQSYAPLLNETRLLAGFSSIQSPPPKA